MGWAGLVPRSRGQSNTWWPATRLQSTGPKRQGHDSATGAIYADNATAVFEALQALQPGDTAFILYEAAAAPSPTASPAAATTGPGTVPGTIPAAGPSSPTTSPTARRATGPGADVEKQRLAKEKAKADAVTQEEEAMRGVIREGEAAAAAAAATLKEQEEAAAGAAAKSKEEEEGLARLGVLDCGPSDARPQPRSTSLSSGAARAPAAGPLRLHWTERTRESSARLREQQEAQNPEVCDRDSLLHLP